jgi:TolA-binding protein
VLALLKDLETKDTTSAENKTKITDTIEKINNNNISVAELKTIIDLLKDMMQQQTKETSSKSPRKRPSITPSTATTDKEPTAPTKDATAATATPTSATTPTKDATAASAA